MSSTRVHDRHISLHLQGSLGESTEGKKRLMGYIFVLRSHALICCHRNANACSKRQHGAHVRSEFLLLLQYKMPRDPYPFPRLQNDGDFCRQQGRRVRLENYSNRGAFLCLWKQVVARRFVPNNEN